MIVCLGATAARALLGRHFRVSVDRGKLVEAVLAPKVMATVHPSSILRIADRTERDAAITQLVDDLRPVSRLLSERR